MAIALDTIRTGKFYRLRNFGEVADFEVLEILGNGDFKVKDLNTLEYFYLTELIKYGKGKDYDLIEISKSKK